MRPDSGAVSSTPHPTHPYKSDLSPQEWRLCSSQLSPLSLSPSDPTEAAAGMSSLQFPGSRAVDRPLASPFWGGGRCFPGRASRGRKVGFASRGGRVCAMSSENPSFRMNLNEYMVTLEKPLGIRFALSSDGKIFVHALKRGVRLLLYSFPKIVTFPCLLPISLCVFPFFLSVGCADCTYFFLLLLFIGNCRCQSGGVAIYIIALL